MATQFAGTSWPAPAPRRSIYDFVPMGLVNGLFFRVLLLVAPIQSVLLTPVQGSTAAFLLILASPIILIGPDMRYIRLLAFCCGFIVLYSLYMALSLSGYMIDQPDMSRLLVIREIYVFGQLKQTHLTQGLYLFVALTFAFLIYQYYQEAFLKYMYYGIILLSIYGFYEFIFYAIYHTNGDFLSNRNFGDDSPAAAAAAASDKSDSVSGSAVQISTIFGSGFMRLKSLVGEPSMYALTVTPFAVYAFGRRWWTIFAVLLVSLVLSTSSTAIIGLVVGLVYVQFRQRHEAALYAIAALIVIVLLYMTVTPVHDLFDKLLFQKADTFSGDQRLRVFTNHALVPFDGNLTRAIFGLGFGTVRSTDMLSNLLANVGLAGLALYSLTILAPCLLLKGGEDRNALVATLLAIFFMEMLTVSEYAYLPPWFMVALGYVRVREQRLARRALPAPRGAR